MNKSDIREGMKVIMTNPATDEIEKGDIGTVKYVADDVGTVSVVFGKAGKQPVFPREIEPYKRPRNWL